MSKHKAGNLGVAELLGHQRAAILELMGRYGITNVRVFGSVARGEAGPDSDIDLLVEAPPGLGVKLMRAGNELEDLLGCPVDLIPENTLRKSIRPTVLIDTSYAVDRNSGGEARSGAGGA